MSDADVQQQGMLHQQVEGNSMRHWETQRPASSGHGQATALLQEELQHIAEPPSCAIASTVVAQDQAGIGDGVLREAAMVAHGRQRARGRTADARLSCAEHVGLSSPHIRKIHYAATLQSACLQAVFGRQMGSIHEFNDLCHSSQCSGPPEVLCSGLTGHEFVPHIAKTMTCFLYYYAVETQVEVFWYSDGDQEVRGTSRTHV